MLVDLKTVLNIAEEKQCAVPAVNVYNQETAMGVLAAAEEKHAAIIMQVYSRLLSGVEAEFLAPALVAAARRASVPVAIHLDHGSDMDVVIKALRYGFTGVMRDASLLSFQENVQILKTVTGLCHAVAVPVEGELGHIGVAADGVPDDYTQVDEAVDYVAQTQVDALAVQVGTAHGHYTKTPRLGIQRIRELHDALPGCSLVLHGGSGVPEHEVREAIRAGIRKVNFSTDMCCTFLDAVVHGDQSVIAIDKFMKQPIEAVKAFTMDKIEMLGAVNSGV